MNANELKAAFAELSPIEPDSTWNKHRLRLREHVASDDIDEFLRWSTVQATMFVGDAPYIKAEYDELPVAWYDAIQEPGFGKPLYIPWVKFKTSGNLIHQAYHLKQWVDKSGVELGDLGHIVEIGSGYGAMALLCERLGFDGFYDSLDFIEFQLLQTYFLQNTLENETGLSYFIWELDELGTASFEGNFDLLIALFSLSEMPIEEREKYLAIDADNYLIAYKSTFEGIDNTAYFEQFRAAKPDIQWFDYETRISPEHRYLIGCRVDRAEKLSKAFGFISVEEVKSLKRLAQTLPDNPVVVNVGAGPGTSALAFLESRPDLTLYTIDKESKTSPHGGLENERRAIKRNFLWKDVAPRYHQIASLSWRAGKKWKNEPVDMVFLDGGHTYDDVKKDILSWLPHLKKGGVIAVHDCYPMDSPITRYDPLRRAVRELLEDHLEFIEHETLLRAYRNIPK